jgi:shikimate dehydrogenase
MRKKKYALIGEKLSHSFSQDFFEKKFNKENIDASYTLIEVDTISTIKEIAKKHDLDGFQITIPYKKSIIQYCDFLADNIAEILSVNTVFVDKETQHFYGCNTDIVGFEASISYYLKNKKKALILGNGATASSVSYVLRKYGINCIFAVRTIKSNNNEVLFDQLQASDITSFDIIINTTSLGMYPKTDNFPPIPYQAIHPAQLVYDVIYNPAETIFLQKAKKQGANCKNGLDFLDLQAKASWQFWNTKTKDYAINFIRNGNVSHG